MLPFTLDTLRLSLHVVATCVWIGGQILVAALVPVMRGISDDAPRQMAQRFGMVAWPAFGLAVLTGVWNLLALPSGLSTAYHVTLGIKVLLVVVTGFAAFVHTRTSKASVRGATGGIGLLASLAVLVLGVML